jgi:hypothetical protein
VYVEEEPRLKANAWRETDSLVSTDERAKRLIVAKNFKSQIQERIKKIDDNVAEAAAVINGGLPALRVVVAVEVCASILALRQRSMSILVSREPAPARSSLDSGNRCVTEDNFCRFIGPIVARLQKDFFCVDCA